MVISSVPQIKIMVMQMQKYFACAVEHCLPSAIPSSLERLEEFELGMVLHYRRRPNSFMTWKRRELHFTGCSLASLMEQGQNAQFVSMRNLIFDAVAASDEKNPLIASDMGKITQVASDISDLISMQQLKVDLTHPVVREAMSQGKTIFVIGTLYQAEHCSVRVRSEATSGTKESTDAWKEGEQ